MFYLVLATICFSLSFGLTKTYLSTIPSEQVVFLRLFIACLIFLPFIKLEDKKNIKAFLIGIIQFGIMYLCFIKAFKYLQGNEVALLTTTTPIFVALWSIIFKEKFRLVYIFSIILSIIGAIIVIKDNITFDFILKGIILMETCNCSFALGQVLWKKYIDSNETKYMSIAYFGAFVFSIPFLLKINTAINLSFEQILSILYLGIIPTGIGFWLWNKGTLKVPYSILAIANNLKIPFGILFSIVIFQEKINITNFLLGCLIMTIGYLILKFPQKK